MSACLSSTFFTSIREIFNSIIGVRRKSIAIPNKRNFVHFYKLLFESAPKILRSIGSVKKIPSKSIEKVWKMEKNFLNLQSVRKENVHSTEMVDQKKIARFALVFSLFIID